MFGQPIKRMTVVMFIGLFTFFPLVTSASATKDKVTSEKTAKKGAFYVQLPSNHRNFAIEKVAPKQYKKWAKKHDSKFVTPYKKFKHKNLTTNRSK